MPIHILEVISPSFILLLHLIQTTLFMIITYPIPCSKHRKTARIYSKMTVKLANLIGCKKIMLPTVKRNGLDIDYRDIPVIINNFNRLEWLKQLIAWLEKAGMKNIFIIDNVSNYPPLLDYYETTKHTVIKLGANLGYKSVWDTKIHLWFKGLPYIYTDPDVLPLDECPLDVIEHFRNLLCNHKDITKVGFGLKIDDIPDHYIKKQEVLGWETKYWNNKIGKNLYKANIDTTFALYAPNSFGQQWGKTLRTSGKYMLRHLPWYENEDSLSIEEKNYRKATIGSSWY